MLERAKANGLVVRLGYQIYIQGASLSRLTPPGVDHRQDTTAIANDDEGIGVSLD
jgi:hypothetical protein